MKKLFPIILCAFATVFSQDISAQTKEAGQQEITKEVEMKEENGVKVLTIKTTAGGVITEEVYKGEVAEQKLAELQNGQLEDQVREEIQVEDHNGVITLTINRTENGETTTEVLKGEAAEKRLKEMNVEAPVTKQPKMIRNIEVEKTEIKED